MLGFTSHHTKSRGGPVCGTRHLLLDACRVLFADHDLVAAAALVVVVLVVVVLVVAVNASRKRCSCNRKTRRC